MKIIFYSIFVSLLFILFNPTIIYAQIIEGKLKVKKKSQEHILFFKKDKKLKGKILKLDEEEIKFRNSKGKISNFKRKEIAKIIVVNNPINTHTKTLGVSPTAFNFKKGERRYTNYYVLANTFGQGITDNFSIIGGLFIPINPSESGIPGGVAVKFTHSLSPKIHLGVVPSLGFLVFPNYLEESELYFLPIIVVSIGTPLKFLNFSISRNYDIYYNEQNEAFSIGGGITLNKHWRLNMEIIAYIEKYDFDEIKYIPAMNAIWGRNNHEIQFGIYNQIAISKEWLFLGETRNKVEWSALPFLSYSYFF